MDKINYQPVGLGSGYFPKHWIRDNTGENISIKNQYYDMYTFHFWLWKNKLKNLEDKKWICFSNYRRFWKNIENNNNIDNNLKNKIIQEAPLDWTGYDTIITEPTDLRNLKLSKIIKKGKFLIFKEPGVLFNKNKITIKFHFDVMHKSGNLEKAVNLINKNDKSEFIEYLNSNTSLHSWNLLCCNSKTLLNDWYTTVFEWLFKCEKVFGFDQLSGYETGRIYAYLAERYLPFWFKKYSKVRTWPIYFHDNKKIF
jgi:hypothetical protein